MSNLQNHLVKNRLWTSSLELDMCLILFSKILLPFRLFRFLFVLNTFETLLSFPVAAATIFCLFFFFLFMFAFLLCIKFLSDPVLPIELLLVSLPGHMIVMWLPEAFSVSDPLQSWVRLICRVGFGN